MIILVKMSNLIWRPKKLIKCSMCGSDHGHTYKIVAHGLWWENDTRTPYVECDFCSICYTVINELWPSKSVQATNCKKTFYSTGWKDSRDMLDNSIKRSPNYFNAFTRHRDAYIKKLISWCQVYT